MLTREEQSRNNEAGLNEEQWRNNEEGLNEEQSRNNVGWGFTFFINEVRRIFYCLCVFIA